MMKQGPPKITVITPTYNQADYLEATLESVLVQQYPNLEYIVIDGGSTDGTQYLIRKYERHIQYWESGQDQGPWDALNKGFARASGDFVAWLNSDDTYEPGALKYVGDFFQRNPDINFLYARPRHIDSHGQYLSTYPMMQATWEMILYGGLILGQETCFWRRSILPQGAVFPPNRFDKWFAFDYDLWLRLLTHQRPYFAQTFLANFREQEGQLTGNWKGYLIDMVRMRDRRMQEVGDSPEEARWKIELWYALTAAQLEMSAKRQSLPWRGYIPRNIWFSGWPFGTDPGQPSSVNGSAGELPVRIPLGNSKIQGAALALKRIVADGHQRIALWGAGKHSVSLLERYDLSPVRIQVIIDDAPTRNRIAGIDVVTPERMDGYSFTAVLISSDAFESQLCNRARECGLENVYSIYDARGS